MIIREQKATVQVKIAAFTCYVLFLAVGFFYFGWRGDSFEGVIGWWRFFLTIFQDPFQLYTSPPSKLDALHCLDLEKTIITWRDLIIISYHYRLWYYTYYYYYYLLCSLQYNNIIIYYINASSCGGGGCRAVNELARRRVFVAASARARRSQNRN